jgi:hypothetical protein
MIRDIKLQSDRPNPSKPSVVKDYLGWWAQVRAPHGHINRVFRSQPEALTKALRFAAGDFEDDK